MPPKAANKQAKAEKAKASAAKAKTMEDKTFGLKNKNKSKVVQKQVAQLQKSGQPSQKEQRLAEPSHKDKKKAEADRAAELNELFAVAIKQPKVPVGVDPKSIVCEYHKAGQCTKGFKCKFSHDLNQGRKTAKMDIYTDRREAEEGMEDWDQEQLEKAVAEKHAAEKGPQKTDIICKFFLDAVERKLYGWFWQCPNGKECKYRHALPPGFVLKSQMKVLSAIDCKKSGTCASRQHQCVIMSACPVDLQELLEAEKENQQDIVDLIDEERAKVKATTQITEAVFQDWHEQRQRDRRKAEEDKEAFRRKKGQLTGREIFMEEGFAVEDDLGATDDYARDDDDENEFRRARDAAVQEQQRMHALNEADAASQAGPSSSSPDPGPSSSSHQNGAAPVTGMSKEDQQLFLESSDDDVEDDDLDDEELDALENSIKHKQ